MFTSDMLLCALFFISFVTLASSKEDFNVTQEALLITQNNCPIIKDDTKAPPIMLAAADLVVIGKSGSVGKTYGEGNTKYEISMTPHCILKGNTDQKELTVRNMGQGDCGATDVEKNDMKPYLFFLRATSDPKVFEALNLGAKRIIDANMIFGPAFAYFCSLKNKKICTGAECVQACNFTPMPSSGCIPFEQNVIDEIKAELRKRTTAAPPPKPTEAPKVMTEAPKVVVAAPKVTEAPKMLESKTTAKPKMDVSTVKVEASAYEPKSPSAETKVQKKTDGKNSASSVCASVVVISVAALVSWMI